MDIKKDFEALYKSASAYRRARPFKISEGTARFEEFKTIVEEMKRRKPVLVVGMGRVGKTSIMRTALRKFKGSFELDMYEVRERGIYGAIRAHIQAIDEGIASIKNNEKMLHDYFRKYKNAYIMIDEMGRTAQKHFNEIHVLAKKYHRFLIGFTNVAYPLLRMEGKLGIFEEVIPIYIKPLSHRDAELIIKKIFHGHDVDIDHHAKEYLLRESNNFLFFFATAIRITSELIVEKPTINELKKLSIEIKGNKYIITKKTIEKIKSRLLEDAAVKHFVGTFVRAYPLMANEVFELDKPIAIYYEKAGLIEKAAALSNKYRVKGEFVREAAKHL